jgi:hypothetical protein
MFQKIPLPLPSWEPGGMLPESGDCRTRNACSPDRSTDGAKLNRCPETNDRGPPLPVRPPGGDMLFDNRRSVWTKYSPARSKAAGPGFCRGGAGPEGQSALGPGFPPCLSPYPTFPR